MTSKTFYAVHDLRWIAESIGIFVATKITHLIDDETVAKMGHPVVVLRSDVGHPTAAAVVIPPEEVKAQPKRETLLQ